MTLCSWGAGEPLDKSWNEAHYSDKTFVTLLMHGELQEFSIAQNSNGYVTYNRCFYRLKNDSKIWQAVPLKDFRFTWRDPNDWPFFKNKHRPIFDKMRELFDLHLSSCRIDAILKS